MSSMEGPMCLIENRVEVGLIINSDALQVLTNDTQPLVVVAITGKYRTGKSYLMNKLAGSRRGFDLGYTIQSKTKGIWMWCLPHPRKPGHTLVLLDTEGLGDVEKGDSKNDAWIFCLAVLLSSNLVVNSIGTIDQQALEQIHFITELTKRIRLKSSTSEEDESFEFKRVFPSFTWCVRDFYLNLEQDGKKITEDEYLLNSLKCKKADPKYNLPRECIIKYFHSHRCFVFNHPTDGKNLWRLEELEDCELDEDFVKQSKRFCDYMLNEGRVKTLPGGLLVSGRLLGNLAVSYVEAIQSGSVPCMENSVLALAQMENSGAVTDAVSKYETDMNERVKGFPTETLAEFHTLHQECEKNALEVFLKRSFNDKDHKYQQELKSLLEQKAKHFSQCNEKVSEELCKSLLYQLSVTMEKKIKESEYFKPGGHKHYLEEKIGLLEAYNTKPGKGIKALEVLQKFLAEKEDVEAAILMADQTLTEKEKEIAEEQARSETAERERQILEDYNKRLEAQVEAQEKSFEQHKQMLMQKMEEDKEKMMKERQWMLEQKLKEKEDLINAGFREKIDELEKKISELEEKKCVIQ